MSDELIHHPSYKATKLITPLVCTTTAILHKGHLLLGYAIERTDRLGRKLDSGWQMPGGKVEPHEQLDVAAAREVHEEVGILIEPHRLKLFGILRMNDFVTFCYLVHLSGERPTPRDMEPEKNRDWQWFPMTQVMHALQHEEGHWHDATAKRHGIPQPMFPPLRRAIGEGVLSAGYRKEFIPGASQHCMLCHGRLPCACFRSEES